VNIHVFIFYTLLNRAHGIHHNKHLGLEWKLLLMAISYYKKSKSKISEWQNKEIKNAS